MSIQIIWQLAMDRDRWDGICYKPLLIGHETDSDYGIGTQFLIIPHAKFVYPMNKKTPLTTHGVY